LSLLASTQFPVPSLHNLSPNILPRLTVPSPHYIGILGILSGLQGSLEEIFPPFAGEPIIEGLFLFIALFWLIILTMAFLSLTLKDSINRWANIILGIVLAAFSLPPSDLSGQLIQRKITIFLVNASLIVVAAPIVWHAWKWPKQKPES